MKLRSIFYLLAFSLVILSCNSDDEYEYVDIATPVLMSKADFRELSVEIKTPESINEAGKIYAYKDYIFVSDVDKGVHVIDNTNPEQPQAIKFLKIIGNEDISVKDNFLYADSGMDLLVFDISDINTISLTERLEDVFKIHDLNAPRPIEADEVDYSSVNFDEDIIVDWTVTTEKREILTDDNVVAVDFEIAESFDSNTGQGGSLARFKIVDDYLYSVSSYEMFIFNISNLAEPILANTQYTDWGIETIFYADNYLYLGGERGMYIYDIHDASNPTFVSEFTHWEGCDPVVVDGDYAYLTLRGGNLCGQQESVLEVIDISDKTSPVLASRYTLENPYGLGIKDNTLFVCDGTAGLKLFNKTDPFNLELTKQFNDIQTRDVIPLENSLLMIGNNTLYQYNYTENGVALISRFLLN